MLDEFNFDFPTTKDDFRLESERHSFVASRQAALAARSGDRRTPEEIEAARLRQEQEQAIVEQARIQRAGVFTRLKSFNDDMKRKTKNPVAIAKSTSRGNIFLEVYGDCMDFVECSRVGTTVLQAGTPMTRKEAVKLQKDFPMFLKGTEIVPISEMKKFQ